MRVTTIVASGNDNPGYRCYVCDTRQRDTGNGMFHMPDMPMGLGLSHWMCGSCLAKAIRDGTVRLYAGPSEVDEPGHVAAIEPDETSTFEVSW